MRRWTSCYRRPSSCHRSSYYRRPSSAPAPLVRRLARPARPERPNRDTYAYPFLLARGYPVFLRVRSVLGSPREKKLVPGAQEDLPRHLARAQLAGALLGETPGPAPQEGGRLRELLARLLRPRHARNPSGLRFSLRLAQGVVEGVGEDARAGVAHQGLFHEGA